MKIHYTSHPYEGQAGTYGFVIVNEDLATRQATGPKREGEKPNNFEGI